VNLSQTASIDGLLALWYIPTQVVLVWLFCICFVLFHSDE